MFTNIVLPSLIALASPLPVGISMPNLLPAVAAAQKRRPIVVAICRITRGKARICNR